MAWTTPKTWNIGDQVTAAEMNTHVRDNQTYLHDRQDHYSEGTALPEGSVTGAPGDIYRRTSNTLGDYEYVKSFGSGTDTTGWIPTGNCDSGLRYIGASMINSWAVSSSTCHIRRIGNVATFTIWADAASATDDEMLTIPSGFGPTRHILEGTFDSPTGGARMYIPSTTGTLQAPARTTGTIYWAASWVTPDVWPTSLPGTAA